MINNRDICFVVCCKSDGENPFIYKCVESIEKVYPYSRIVIVDSCSTNRNYISEYKNKEYVLIEDIQNKNYEYGAIVHSFNKYKTNYKVFVFIQDSMIVNNTINEIHKLRNQCVIFKNEKTGWLHDKIAFDDFYCRHLDFPKLSKNDFYMVIWNSFAIKTNVFDMILQSELFSKIKPPQNKIGSQYMERAWGILFNKNEIEFKINEGCITKIFGRRQ